MTSAEIRQQFIDFFVQKHGHAFVPSSPVVPLDDPTLLFTNAGMNQFKPIFLGQEKRDYTRVANTQKCIRAGGKHNDLDDVGRSRRHHTFFEMLGNWSFGDYFKRDAIAWSWELLTKVWGLDPTRLHVTVHAGEEAIGVARDEEAAKIWREVAGLPDDHIHYGPTKDNFWEMGETGPCGPCTEIFVDRTPDKTGGPTVLTGEDPRVMEIWNNVFIQYNRNPDRTLTPLPAKHVDTGMGLERIIQVLQGKNDNYAIDLFDPFWAKLKELSGITYEGKYPKGNEADPEAEAKDAQLRHDIAFRVIADHIRCLTFALTDGAVPDKEGRGYVLRSILRRAVFWGRKHLGIDEPFLHLLVPVVVEAMGNAFPELRQDPRRVSAMILSEEVSFGRTWSRGIDLFEEAYRRSASQYAVANPEGGWEKGKGPIYDSAHIEKYPANKYPRGVISDQDAFKLHDTFGFPIGLTRIMAEERGIPVDLEGFEKLMEEARRIAREGGKGGDTRIFDLPPDVLDALGKDGVAKTDDSAKFNAAPIGASVMAIWDGFRLLDQTHGAEAAEMPVAVVLDKTNFYAEMGGQVGDTGELRTSNALLDVTTTRIAGGYVLHVGRMVEGHLKVGDHVTATLAGVRKRTEKNHTATHVANWALREVLGEGVQQKGSLVDPEKLRFDFSHDKAISDDELTRVEQLAGEAIKKNLKVYAQNAPQEQALKINGLRAVFGEKYPPMVRVVSIGVPVDDLLKKPTSADWRQYSVEFCGGTHLGSTGEISAFIVAAEESVSKGIRRIVAFTGESAMGAMQVAQKANELIERAKSVEGDAIRAVIAGLAPDEVRHAPLIVRRRAQAAIAQLQSKLKSFEKAQKQAAASSGSGDAVAAATKLLESAPSIGGAGKLVIAEIPGATGDGLLAAFDSIKKKVPSYALMLAATGDGKVSFVAAVSDDLIAKGLKAGDWIRETAKVAGGGGGGRPQMAQAGGKDAGKVGEALEAARKFAASALKS